MLRTDKILPVTQVKRELMRLLKTLQSRGESITITKDGRVAGILMSPEIYEGLIETIEILEDQKLTKGLKKALKNRHEGKLYSEDEAFED